MARYLVVAHRTAKSPELAAKLKELLAQDPEARFVLLVPAVPLPGGSTRRTRCGAGPRRKRRRPSGPSEAQGIPVEEAKAGDISPSSP